MNAESFVSSIVFFFKLFIIASRQRILICSHYLNKGWQVRLYAGFRTELRGIFYKNMLFDEWSIKNLPLYIK
jgi:hypothetical protein